ncbi:hypothetical protein XENOCAPTIV_028994, partial [Xenoophorus captivus]
LPVITSNTIVRCRSCRTYINPFVTFLDQRRWKCNLCYRVNDVPDEFMYNPVTRSYGEPHKRPEVQNSTVEFIASSDYMLRPPQPAVYLFALEVSHNAVEAGYLKYFCESLLENLDKLPGDARTRVGFLTFDSTVHFYNLQEGLSQPQMLVVSDIDDVFIPSHDSLMVNLKESKEGVQHLGPATDFYKKLALDCSGQQIGVDLFLLSSQYADLASLGKNSARLSIHTFHGNFFVRSTDLLSLANVNPDSAFAVQMSIEDSLADSSLACFQAALLYTSSKGKRRIRVHTLCLPVVSQLSDKQRVEPAAVWSCRPCSHAPLPPLHPGFTQTDLNVTDILKMLKIISGPFQKALRTGTSTRLDERICAMCEFKTQPLPQLMRMVHPDLYRLDNITDQPHLLHLSAERLSRDGAFLMDCGNVSNGYFSVEQMWLHPLNCFHLS